MGPVTEQLLKLPGLLRLQQMVAQLELMVILILIILILVPQHVIRLGRIAAMVALEVLYIIQVLLVGTANRAVGHRQVVQEEFQHLAEMLAVAEMGAAEKGLDVLVIQVVPGTAVMAILVYAV